MDKPTTPMKKCHHRHAAIVVDSSDAAVAIAELFDRTAKCVALCNEFTQAFARQTDQGRDPNAAVTIDDAHLYQKLRQNLERADRAPRCEKVREDGTVCGSPKMKGYDYCYAHDRMRQVRPQKLALPALEDALLTSLFDSPPG